MKILVISYGYSEKDVSESYSAFRLVQSIRRFHHVTVLTKDPVVEPDAIQLSVNPLLAGSVYQRALKLDYFGFMWKAYRFAKAAKVKYDVVHHISPISLRYPNILCNLPIPFIWGPVGGSIAYPPGFDAVRRREPLIVRLRVVDKWRLRVDPLMINTLQRARAIVLTSRAAAELIPSRYRHKAVVIPEAVDAADLPHYSPGDPALPYIFSSGRLVPYKGTEFLIRAFARAELGVDVQLWISGDGPELARLEELIRSLGVTARIRMLGRVSKDENFRLMAQSLFCAFPALNEAFGHVNVEAMSLGKAVIASKWGGPADIVDDGVTGFGVELIKPDQFVDDMAAAMAQLVKDVGLRSAMSANAAARARACYSPNAVAERYDALYREVLAGSAGST